MVTNSSHVNHFLVFTHTVMNNTSPLLAPQRQTSPQPPPLPPRTQSMIKRKAYGVKPKAFSLSASENWSIREDDHELEFYDVVKSSEAMPLNRVVEEASHLPVTVAMKESLYGICGDWSLFEGQLLNIHYQKETEVVSVQIDGGAQYVVPLNSTLQCSILYDPLTNIELAKMGFDFQNVLGIIEAKPMPKVVAVTVDCSPVTKGEILMIKSVQYQENNSEKRQILCLSVKTGTEKWLNEDCEGCFTTEIQLIKLHLSELIPHVSLPIQAVFFDSRETGISLPLNVDVGPCIIDYHRVEKSIVTSVDNPQCLSPLLKEKASPNMEVIEILLMNVNFAVQQMNLSFSKSRELSKRTYLLKESLPSQVDRVIVSLFSTTNALQTKLFKAVYSPWTRKRSQQVVHSQTSPYISFVAKQADEMHVLPKNEADEKDELIINRLYQSTPRQPTDDDHQYTPIPSSIGADYYNYNPYSSSESLVEPSPSPTESDSYDVLDRNVTEHNGDVENSGKPILDEYANLSKKTVPMDDSLRQQIAQLCKTTQELIHQMKSLCNTNKDLLLHMQSLRDQLKSELIL